jgi:glycosyltransferase involved in cell wall biosynthesis
LDNQPKKVFILGTAWPFRGGLAAFNERLANEFESKGISTEIITFTVQYPNLLFPGKTQFSEEPSKFENIKRKLSSINPITWWSTAKYINRQNPDLLITRYWIPFMGPCLGTVVRLLNKNIKVICLLDNVVPHEKRIGDVVFTKYFVKPIENFVAMSKSVMEDLHAFKKGGKCILNPHPVFDNFGEKIDQQKAKAELGLDLKNDYVLFFGFIRKYKGLDLAIRAFAEWRNQLPNKKLIIAGEFYGDADFYYSIAEELGIKEDIIWHTDFIPDSKVKNYFSACDLVLQPYYSATQSGVTQIAYQFEVPMIVTKVGGLPELVQHGKTGYLVEQDPKEIAQHVVQFYEKGRSAFDADMKKAKEQFSWKSLVNNFIKLYQES